MEKIVGLLPLALALSGCAFLGVGDLTISSPQASSDPMAMGALTFPRTDSEFGIVCRGIDEPSCIEIAAGVRTTMSESGITVASVEVDAPLGLVILCGSGPVPESVICDRMPLDNWTLRFDLQP